MTQRATLLFALLVTAMLIACVTHPPIDKGIIATEGMTITAEDGSFTLKSGVEFKPPFSNDLWNFLDIGYDEHSELATSRIKDNYRYGLKNGGKRVLITLPGRSAPLYGILLLNLSDSRAYGPASRMYRIEIPQKYIEAALSGQLTVIYEWLPFRTPIGVEGVHYAWILWLSDQPL